jgi:hypothetical protein
MSPLWAHRSGAHRRVRYRVGRERKSAADDAVPAGLRTVCGRRSRRDAVTFFPMDEVLKDIGAEAVRS